MKKSQIELMHVLKNVDKWLTAYELAKRIEMSPNQVRRLIATAPFKDVVKGMFDTGRPNGGRYVAVYKLMDKQKSNVEDALTLAKQHAGIWGQLSWSNQARVERI